MKHKKIFLILCSVILIFTVANIAASDVNDTLTSSDNSTELIEQSEDKVLESSEENVISSSDDGSFTSLQNIINNASKNSVINLDKDYAYDAGFSTRGIVIDKNLTINGNGHTLDGKSKSRILLIHFGILKDNYVTLNNIKFVNGYTDLYGGAIFNYANLTVNKCEFKNNYAYYCGGAINSVGYLNCKNSNFVKNTANGDGGALFTLSIEKSFELYPYLHINKTIDGDMGIILNLALDNTLKFSKDLVSNCAFTSNVANGRGGGAIYAFSNIYIKSSKFTSNKAGEKGGAVFGNKDLYITSCSFTKNKASKYGGAVYFKCHESSGHYEGETWVSEVKYYSNSIKSSTFTKNSASKGGAIYGFRTSSSDTTHCAKAIECTFTANKATKSGRDIYGGTTSKCTFNYLKLTLKTVKIKKSAKKLVLKAKLTKGKTLIKGKTITFKFNGKTYKAKTNKKGIAKVTIKKSILKKLKIGKKVKYQVKYSSLTVKKTAKVKK